MTKPTHRVRAGIIGAGHMGRYHVAAYSELFNVDLVGVCDVNPQKAELAAAPFGVPTYTDYRQLFGKVDVVSVAVPPTHRDRDVGEVESPVPVEQDDVGKWCPHLESRPVQQIVQKHRFELGAGEELLVAARLHGPICVQRQSPERTNDPDARGQKIAERHPGGSDQRSSKRSERRQPTTNGIRAHPRRNAAEHADPMYPFGDRRPCCKGIRSTSGEADDAQGVDAQVISQQ